MKIFWCEVCCFKQACVPRIGLFYLKATDYLIYMYNVVKFHSLWTLFQMCQISICYCSFTMYVYKSKRFWSKNCCHKAVFSCSKFPRKYFLGIKWFSCTSSGTKMFLQFDIVVCTCTVYIHCIIMFVNVIFVRHLCTNIFLCWEKVNCITTVYGTLTFNVDKMSTKTLFHWKSELWLECVSVMLSGYM